MSDDGPNVVEVQIFGATYPVRGDQDADYIRGLATLVDQKMREIADKAHSADTAKLAILTALNLADELKQSRGEQDGDRDEIEARVEALNEELANSLEVRAG